MSTKSINGGEFTIPASVGSSTTGGLSPTEGKTKVVATSAFKESNGSGGTFPLSNRVNPNPVGRTWPQFWQVLGSKVTFGWIPPPMPRVSSVVIESVSDIPESVGPTVIERERVPSDPPPPSTGISRALDAIWSVFTAIYNMLFGARSA